MVAHVEILVEDLSSEAVLRAVVPRIIGNLTFDVYPYRCKADLLKKLPSRLRGYAARLPDDWRILVVADRDRDRCTELKRVLERAARDANLPTRTNRVGREYRAVNRLAIEEVEAWYFGDWEAVRRAYPKVDENVPNQKRYRDPDAIDGTWEALERVLRRSGYFRTGLRKIEAARAIAQHMDPHRNRSRSFQKLREALSEMARRVPHAPSSP